ncbi:MAG: hypothetical protein CMM98_02035 [Rickettsiales bacterium]|nr:hypothetical protein [Rickettsiales bacterium]
MKNLILKIFTFSLFILSSSCAEKEDNKLLGQIIGSVAGAYLGSKLGDGTVGNLTTVLGGTVGFLIGGKIVDILDPEEQSELNNAVSQTLTKNPDNVSRKWNSQKNLDTNAEIIPLNSYQIDQNTCRDFTKTVNKGDKQFQEKSTACRDEKGNWRII